MGIQSVWNKDDETYANYFGSNNFSRSYITWQKLCDNILCLDLMDNVVPLATQLEMVKKFVRTWDKHSYSSTYTGSNGFQSSVDVPEFDISHDYHRQLALDIEKLQKSVETIEVQQKVGTAPSSDELDTVLQSVRNLGGSQKDKFKFFVVSPDELKLERNGHKSINPIVRFMSVEPVQSGSPEAEDFWDVEATLGIMTYFYMYRNDDVLSAQMRIDLGRFLEPLGYIIFGFCSKPISYELTQTDAKCRYAYCLAVILFSLVLYVWMEPCMKDPACHLDQSKLDANNPSGVKSRQEALFYKNIVDKLQAQLQAQEPGGAMSDLSSL
jgi:hypothetical protein